MRRIGTISYNIYCNFTNYGSALQTWALHQAIKKVAENTVEPVLVDYCPEILADKDPLNPFANMWDKDDESRRMCELNNACNSRELLQIRSVLSRKIYPDKQEVYGTEF